MRLLTVSEVVEQARWLLEDRFGSVALSGEISGSKRASSGHCYFSLKDEKASIQAVMWSTQAHKLAFKIQDGIRCICHGKLTIYPPSGRFQMVVQTMEPEGIGALQLAFEQLRKKLSSEGLFDPEHKKPIPVLPLSVGLITSPTGAAIEDFQSMLSLSRVPIALHLFESRVQGKEAAGDIVNGLRYFSREKHVDVVVITRGGGSLEDLQPFNEEMVARAVFHAVPPVISAVGHEVDTTICDMVADLRCPTPTAAGEYLATRVTEQAERISRLSDNLRETMERLVYQYLDRLTGYRRVFSILNLSRLFKQQEVILNGTSTRLTTAMHRTMSNRRRDFESVHRELKNQVNRFVLNRVRDLPARRFLLQMEKQLIGNHEKKMDGLRRNLQLLSPVKVLSRGYSITRVPGDGVVTDSDQVHTGEELEIMLHKGGLTCRITDKN